MPPDSNAASEPAEASQGAADQTVSDEGRYIPYSGGSAGWFENSGVLKSEQPNNYRYHVEMDRPEVRSRQFERWGPSFDRRGDPRKRHQLPINLVRNGVRTAMTTWDINTRGIRLQLADAGGLASGENLQVELLDLPGGQPVLTLDGQVVWAREEGTTQKLWNVGIFFPSITHDEAAQMVAQLGV